MLEEVLAGGFANAGAVVRVGAHVLRPGSPQTPAIHALLRHARLGGFDGVPVPVGIDADGRERLQFIEGDVPIAPFPAWSLTDEALASVAVLLRRFHEAAGDFQPPADAAWSDELADPAGGPAVCHNDVCPENIVFRDGRAVAFIDFDFAAPGRPIFDLAQLARMCVPMETPVDAQRLGRGGLDPFQRLGVVADNYGLGPPRAELLDALEMSMRVGEEFICRRVKRGDSVFVAMLDHMGGRERFVRRRRWLADNHQRFLDALG